MKRASETSAHAAYERRGVGRPACSDYRPADVAGQIVTGHWCLLRFVARGSPTMRNGVSSTMGVTARAASMDSVAHLIRSSVLRASSWLAA
mmetsp:Transcript_5703/g.16184  ORF Transcript_5703/g.16184 Transcript_5703/m.16184 type:complete len:91 (+) Transcript_5703:555-827(+)